MTTPPTRLRLTKTAVKAIPPPQSGTTDHDVRGYSIAWDDDLKGFGLLTTVRGVKSYIVRARIHGKERRHTLGRANVLSADKARALAVEWLGQIASGHDPVADQQRAKLASVTLGMALDRYAAKPGLAANTVQKLNGTRKTLAEWLDLPLLRIDEAMVRHVHARIAADRPGAATVAFRHFLSAWNLERISSKEATGEYLLPECPTRTLTERGLWTHHARRERAIHPHQMQDWFTAVESLPNPKAAAFLKFCLLTGCRRDEAARLTWADTDLTGRFVIFRNTKAGKTKLNPDHYLPLPHQAMALLTGLQQQAVGECVFGDDLGRYRGEDAFQYEIRTVRETYGDFGPHDCRRTFISISEIVGVPTNIGKKLTNHSAQSDVHGGYVVAGIEELRGPIQRIADQIDIYRLGPDNVIPMRKAAT